MFAAMRPDRREGDRPGVARKDAELEYRVPFIVCALEQLDRGDCVEWQLARRSAAKADALESDAAIHAIEGQSAAWRVEKLPNTDADRDRADCGNQNAKPPAKLVGVREQPQRAQNEDAPHPEKEEAEEPMQHGDVVDFEYRSSIVDSHRSMSGC